MKKLKGLVLKKGDLAKQIIRLHLNQNFQHWDFFAEISRQELLISCTPDDSTGDLLGFNPDTMKEN